MNTKSQNVASKLIPIMLAFFVMGFVDLVGTATNFIKEDFQLSDKIANLLPSMVFFWFLIFSVPTGLLMNRIGRRKTVVLSLGITALSLMLPLFGYSFGIMMVSFCLLGIGNTLLQVSINPLMTNIVRGDKLASNMTLGQFVKAIASFMAPYIASWSAAYFGNWRLLFPIYMVIAVIATLWLGVTKIEEGSEKTAGSSFGQCFSLLGKTSILLFFLGIMCHVGIDVGINVTAPKIMTERFGIPVDQAVKAASVYFLFRLLGCLSGTFILSRYNNRKFFGISVACMVLSMVGFFVFSSPAMFYVSLALVGFGNSNIFPVIVSKAMLGMPDKKNEISGLMIMGLFGGTIFPILMGFASDAMGSQNGALIVISVGVLYLLYLTFKMEK